MTTNLENSNGLLLSGRVGVASPGGSRRETTSLAQLRHGARKQMDEAIKLIPMERKAAYLEALKKVPNLVQTESDPLKFLRRCDYNIWDASERLCLYWKERRSIFGPERAFLPLILTGTGALEKNDILSLQAGFPAILPRSQTTGKQVMYFDRRQFLPDMTAADRHRGLFYLFHVLAQDESAQTDGVLVFILLVTPRFPGMDYEFAIRALKYSVHAMPVKIQLHLLNILPKGANRKLYAIQDLISSSAGHCINSGAELEVHIERDHESELLQLLQTEFGLSTAGIPTAMGGSWAFVESSVWCRNQALAERKQYKWLQKRSPRSDKLSDQFANVATAATSSDEETRLAKKRAANVIYSRRKRERRRQEWSLLNAEKEQLLQEKLSLKRENARLENLCWQAQAVFGTKKPPEDSSAPECNFPAVQQHKQFVREDPVPRMFIHDDHHCHDEHGSQCSGESPQQHGKQEEQAPAALEQRANAVPSPPRTSNFSRIAAEAICCSSEERNALIRLLSAQQQSQSES